MSNTTARTSYFENFAPGQVMRHARGKTMTEMDNVLITNMVLNTADAHFDEHRKEGNPFGTRVVFGGVNLSFVIGLAAQDTAENAIAELSMDKIRLKNPVFHGDTIYAFTEVQAVENSDRPDAGIVHFRHWGVNQDDTVVVEAERRVLIKRASHWLKDEADA